MDKQQVNKILIADDKLDNREFVRWMLTKAGYHVDTVEDGPGVLEFVKDDTPDLILMDIMMPGMDGIEVCRRLKSDPATRDIIVLFVSGIADRRTRLDAFNAGGSDFIAKPFDRVELLLRVNNLMKVKRYLELMHNQAKTLEQEVEKATMQLRTAYEKLNEAYVETVEKLTVAAEFRDEETGQHIRRIGHYARAVARELGMDNTFCEQIFYSAPMHDIGKIAIPDSILLKTDRLTDAEFRHMKDHTVIGWKLLKDSKSEMLQMGAAIALSHHERFDGTGYPHGLKGNEIPLEGRIVMTIDVYDALRSKRPYKPPFDHKTALNIILKGDSRLPRTSFDPEILAVVERIQDQIADIFEQLKEPET